MIEEEAARNNPQTAADLLRGLREQIADIDPASEVHMPGNSETCTYICYFIQPWGPSHHMLRPCQPVTLSDHKERPCGTEARYVRTRILVYNSRYRLHNGAHQALRCSFDCYNLFALFCPCLQAINTLLHRVMWRFTKAHMQSTRQDLS
ncbi:unnamed protein product, partial [Ectocarpus sp. 12 AP-2014]